MLVEQDEVLQRQVTDANAKADNLFSECQSQIQYIPLTSTSHASSGRASSRRVSSVRDSNTG